MFYFKFKKKANNIIRFTKLYEKVSPAKCICMYGTSIRYAK